MLRNKLSIIGYTVLLSITCVSLVACGNNDDSGENKNPVHDTSKWFTEEELSLKGLTGLTAPTGLSGEMQSSDAWYNGGYSFSQVCPNDDTFMTNAETYFSYFKTNYNGMFGKPKLEKFSMDTNENWYIIEQKNDLSDYFDNNPSNLYKFYYVRDNTLDNDYLQEARFGFLKLDMNLILILMNINLNYLLKVLILLEMEFIQIITK